MTWNNKTDNKKSINLNPDTVMAKKARLDRYKKSVAAVLNKSPAGKK